MYYRYDIPWCVPNVDILLIPYISRRVGLDLNLSILSSPLCLPFETLRSKKNVRR